MSRRIGFARAAADHRAAIEEVARVLESHDPEFWTAPREPGKWSPAEIAQHLALSYEPALAELDGGRGYAVRLAWWTRTALRVFMVPRILAGKFPKGAPAPRESRPQGGASSPAEGARLLREKAALFESRIGEAHAARRARVTHPYFGKLTAPQILKVLAAHAAHHRDQLRPPRTRAEAWDTPRGDSREDDPNTMIERLKESGEKAFGFKVTGKVTAAEVEAFLPQIEFAIRDRGKRTIGLLADLSAMKGAEWKARWDEIRFLSKYAEHIERVAVVGAGKWEDVKAEILAGTVLIQAETRYYPAADVLHAWHWIKTGDASGGNSRTILPKGNLMAGYAPEYTEV